MSLYDKKIYGAELHPGSGVLIRNLNKKEARKAESILGCHTKRKHHSPVYEVKPEDRRGCVYLQ